MAVIGCKNWEVCQLYGPQMWPIMKAWKDPGKGKSPESVKISCEAVSVLLKK